MRSENFQAKKIVPLNETEERKENMDQVRINGVNGVNELEVNNNSTSLPNSRRQFLGNTLKASLAVGLSLYAGSSLLSGCSVFKNRGKNPADWRIGYTQDRLPYAYQALEPVIDRLTMEIHHTKHAAGYTKNLMDEAPVMQIDPAKISLEDLLGKISKYSQKLRNNAGGHYNHELFWKCMTPNAPQGPSGKLLADLEMAYGSLAEFKSRFSDEAKNRFGSGWAWLYLDNSKKLRIGSTPNQDNPLMDVSTLRGMPLLGIDVWEHAYYLKYQNKRADYVEQWWKVVNWEYVQKRYEAFV